MFESLLDIGATLLFSNLVLAMSVMMLYTSISIFSILTNLHHMSPSDCLLLTGPPALPFGSMSSTITFVVLCNLYIIAAGFVAGMASFREQLRSSLKYIMAVHLTAAAVMML